MNDDTGKHVWLVAFALPVVVLLVHAFYYFPYFVDDAFISMRYAQRLAAGNGLTWNDGEYVEGYSDLLWVLLMAAFSWLGFDMLAAARVVGLVSSLATMLAFVYYALYIGRAGRHALLWANMAFAFSAPVAIWALAGLECSLVMALLAWIYILAMKLLDTPSLRPALTAGALLALLCLCRPEGPLFTIIVASGVLLLASQRRHLLLPLGALCAVPAATYLLQLGFRLSYYGSWFANTVHAKVAWTASRLINGGMYVIKALAVFAPLLLLFALQLDRLRSDEMRFKRCLFLLWVSGAWMLVVAIGGGDFFPGFRHALAIVPAIIILALEAAEMVYAGSGRQSVKQVFMMYILVCFLWLQFSFTEHQEAKNTQYWNEYGVSLAKELKTRYGDSKPTIAVALAGVIPFYSELPSLDMFRLTDPDMVAQPGVDFGHGFLGHDLLNVPYVLARKPDIIVFFLGGTPPLHSFAQNAEFRQQYHKETVELPDYTATIWLRNNSNKLK